MKMMSPLTGASNIRDGFLKVRDQISKTRKVYGDTVEREKLMNIWI